MKTRRTVTILCFAFFSVCALLAKDIKKVTFNVPQMVCENCEKKVKDNIRFEKGVKDIETNVAEKTVQITYDAEKTDVQKLTAGFKKIKYEATCVESDCCDKPETVSKGAHTDDCCKK